MHHCITINTTNLIHTSVSLTLYSGSKPQHVSGITQFVQFLLKMGKWGLKHVEALNLNKSESEVCIKLVVFITLFLSITTVLSKLITHKICNPQSRKQVLDNKNLGKINTKSCKAIRWLELNTGPGIVDSPIKFNSTLPWLGLTCIRPMRILKFLLHGL
jgi:hypothetical protein